MIEIQAVIVCDKCGSRAPTIVRGVGKYATVDLPNGWFERWTGARLCDNCKPKKGPSLWTKP